MLKKFRRPVVSTPSSGSGAFETAITVIITTALAQRNNAGDAMGKYLGGCSLAQRKPSDQRSLHRSLSARRERNLSRHQKIFLQKCFHTKATPLWDRTIFKQVFVRGGMIKCSKWKVPLPGGQARRSRD